MATLSIKNSRLKWPTHSKTNILTLYSPRSFYIEKEDTRAIDAEIVLDLPEKAAAFLISKCKGQKIETIVGPKIQILWLTLLNESYFDRHHIKRKDNWISYFWTKQFKNLLWKGQETADC